MKKVRKKYYTPDHASNVYPSDLEIYYDAENNNKVLNLDNDNRIKVMLLIPIVVFVGIILFGKFVLGVV